MAIKAKIDSNITGLRYAEEATPKVLPGSPIWYPLEPNSYKDFGGNVKTQARTPISSNRQRKKGVVTDVDASGGFQTDVTQENIQDLMQGFMFADFRRKAEKSDLTSVVASDHSYNAASGMGVFVVGALLMAKGFTTSGNNGLKRVTTAASGKTIVAETLYDETPSASAKLVRVGDQATSGDLNIDAGGDLPLLKSTTLDFTTLGLIPGEWIFIGGDVSGNKFATAANNGWKRVKAIAAGALTLDKSDTTMVTDNGSGKTIRIFYGRVLRNEDTSLIVQRTYQLERTLGYPDTDNPTDAQAEYLLGALANEANFKFSTADKLTCELNFIAAEHELVDTATGLKSGDRPDIVEATAFNTSSDFSRIKMNIVDGSNENPLALFAYVTEAAMSIKNNVSPNKVIGSIGAVDMTAGNFEVSGTMTAYFSTVEAIQAVKDNASVTLDMIIAKDNAAILFDLPVITLGEGRAKIEQDQAVTLPLGFDGAIGPNGYTLMQIFFDYVPDAAM